MNPYHHALSSAKQHGGRWEDYFELHHWFDESKMLFPDFRHRALRHHTEGIFLAEKLFGPVITNSNGRSVPTRVLGEQHVKEDLGKIPTVEDWLKCIQPQSWMLRHGNRKAEQEALCDCERPGYFCSGIPGILARMDNDQVAPGAKVERCDACERYETDAAALAKLTELGLASL